MPNDGDAAVDVVVPASPPPATGRGWFRRPCASWCLATFLACCLGWVVAFALVDTHNRAAFFAVYPAFAFGGGGSSSGSAGGVAAAAASVQKAMSGEDGAMLFTYLGVFYLVAGAGTLLFLSAGVQLPVPRPSLVRPLPSKLLPWTGEHWTPAEVAAVGIFLAVQIAVVASHLVSEVDPGGEDTMYVVSKTLGKVTALTMTVLFIPVSKTSFWLDAFNYKFERAIKLHRWLAWFLVFAVVLHAGTGIAAFARKGELRNCLLPSATECAKPGGYGTYDSLRLSKEMMYGWIAAVVLLVLSLTSLNWVRRNMYEIMCFSHRLLILPFVVLLHLHYDGMLYYMAPAMAMYAIDKVYQRCTSCCPVTLVGLSRPAKGFVRMTVAKDSSLVFEPGQWTRVNVPAISYCQWHPMSIASSPNKSTMTIDVKVLGNWTKKLEDLARDFDPSNPGRQQAVVYMDGCHGSYHTRHQGYLNHPAVMCLAGGIGVTPMLSVLRTMAEDPSSYPGVRRLVFVWVVKKESVLDLYRDELAAIQHAQAMAEETREVEVIVHVTRSEKEDDEEDEVRTPTPPSSKGGSEESFDQECPSQGHTPQDSREVSFSDAGSTEAIDSSQQEISGPTANGISRTGRAATGNEVASSMSARAAKGGGTIRSHSRRPWRPLKSYVKGYCHQLVLTLCAGGGYLAGIVIANAIAEGRGWSSDLVSFLQLSLAFSTALIFVACGFLPVVLPSRCREARPAPLASEDAGTEEPCGRKRPRRFPVRVNRGTRPDTDALMLDLRSWCDDHGVSSVGVAVCGPESLVEAAIRGSKEHTSSSVAFVVDEETFEW